jgi:hypothetical protein
MMSEDTSTSSLTPGMPRFGTLPTVSRSAPLTASTSSSRSVRATKSTIEVHRVAHTGRESGRLSGCGFRGTTLQRG